MVILGYYTIWKEFHVDVAISFNLTGQEPSVNYNMGLCTSTENRKAFKTQHHTNRTENTNNKAFSLRDVHVMETYTREKFVTDLYPIYMSSPF